MKNNKAGLSRFLSLILRHRPTEFGLRLDKAGFAPLSQVLVLLKDKFPGVDLRALKLLVEKSRPQRFQIEGGKIRALYGHSVGVEPGRPDSHPPPLLYHGTSLQAYRRIEKKGISRMGRRYVHLSLTEKEALRVASRHTDSPVVLEINTKKALSAGVVLYRSGGVYLAEHLPPQFIARPYLQGRPEIRVALCFDREKEGGVRCRLCGRNCRIQKGKTGFCGVRKNIGGWLFTHNYGQISSLQMRPIEIKPFYHFYPGTQALTYSGWSCNFGCPWCQNWRLSQSFPPERNYLSPTELVQRAVKLKAEGICGSLNEPTLLHEYNLECFRRAKAISLYTTYVSNGFMGQPAARELVEAGLDAINIDIKGDQETYCRYLPGVEVDKVWENVRYFREQGVWVEVTYLVIPGVNDSEEAADGVIERHLSCAGPEIPLHVNRYFPAYRLDHSPTPLGKLKMISKRARSQGIKYVYLGNTDFDQNTYCPECEALLVERNFGSVKSAGLSREGLCSNCGARISLRPYSDA